jgi:hypothetical protein
MLYKINDIAKCSLKSQNAQQFTKVPQDLSKLPPTSEREIMLYKTRSN